MLEISSDATEPLRCHDCVHSNDDGRGAEHVAVLLLQRFAVLEISSDATEPLRCHDCVHSSDDDGSAQHVAVLELRRFAVRK